MNTKQGAFVRKVTNGRVSTPYILLEREIGHDYLNAFLYDTADRPGDNNPQWWPITDDEYKHWEVKTSTGEWKRIVIPMPTQKTPQEHQNDF